jgi:protein-ribulosamine 3-kinase
MFSEDTYIQFFENIILDCLGTEEHVLNYHFLGGGNINSAVRVVGASGTYFVKWNESQEQDIFEKEAYGLEQLRKTNTLKIPEVLGWGSNEGKSYLLLEYIDSAMQRPTYWTHLGESLAEIHAHTHKTFGLEHDNYLGALTQHNEPSGNGVQFYIEKRLRVQAGLALYNNEISKEMFDRITKLFDKFRDLVPNERPALLHGDLWIGNIMTCTKGTAALIDPAIYFGLREAELAFTKLFGGFHESFYKAYNEAFPLEPGFEERMELYNLYPLLVHVNLFGAGYVSGVERILRKYC